MKFTVILVGIDNAYCLYEGIDDGGSYEFQASLLEVLAQCIGKGRGGDGVLLDERLRSIRGQTKETAAKVPEVSVK